MHRVPYVSPVASSSPSDTVQTKVRRRSSTPHASLRIRQQEADIPSAVYALLMLARARE